MPTFPHSSIQGNVLKSFKRLHACYLMLRFSDDAYERRDRLGKILRAFVSSAEEQANVTKAWKADQRLRPVGMLGLTSVGYRRLRLYGHAPKREDLGASTFHELRGALYPTSTTEFFEPTYKEPIDAFLLLADSDLLQLERLVLRAKAELGDESVSVVTEEWGARMLDAEGNDIEHFGFRDSISRGPKPDSVLTPEDSSELEGAGTYGVFLKIEQDVEAFQRQLREMRGLYNQLHVPITADVRAQVIGRSADGRPLADADGTLDDFTFAKDPSGSKCPLQAHVRAMHPRDGRPSVVLRRGMSYGSNSADAAGPKGLLFFGLHRSLLDFTNTMRRAARLRDPILSNSQTWSIDNPSETHCPHNIRAQRWRTHDRDVCFRFADVTKLRGGRFFYIPSIPFIENLGTLTPDAKPTPWAQRLY